MGQEDSQGRHSPVFYLCKCVDGNSCALASVYLAVNLALAGKLELMDVLIVIVSAVLKLLGRMCN